MWNGFRSLKRQWKNQPFKGLKWIKPEDCVCRTNDFSPSTTETTVCQPRQIQGQRLQNPDCNRRGCQVRSSGMRSWNLSFKPCLLSLKSSTSTVVPLQRFGYSNSPGCNQPQHPRTPQDLHPQSRTNGKSGWTSHFFFFFFYTDLSLVCKVFLKQTQLTPTGLFFFCREERRVNHTGDAVRHPPGPLHRGTNPWVKLHQQMPLTQSLTSQESRSVARVTEEFCFCRD